MVPVHAQPSCEIGSSDAQSNVNHRTVGRLRPTFQHWANKDRILRTLLIAILILVSALWSSTTISFSLKLKAAETAETADGVAVIIGSKNYAEGVPAVDFAHNDADAMPRFVVEVLGFREGNILDLRDATQAQLFSAFGRPTNHRGKLWSWARSGESDIVVLYSGHGVPGQRDRKGYLLPVNADPDTPEINGYSLDTLYSNLVQIGARSVTVYLDACFSGESPRGMLIRTASTIVEKWKLPEGASGLTVITAAAADELASWDEEAGHGLFTRSNFPGMFTFCGGTYSARPISYRPASNIAESSKCKHA